MAQFKCLNEFLKLNYVWLCLIWVLYYTCMYVCAKNNYFSVFFFLPPQPTFYTILLFCICIVYIIIYLHSVLRRKQCETASYRYIYRTSGNRASWEHMGGLVILLHVERGCSSYWRSKMYNIMGMIQYKPRLYIRISMEASITA